MNLATLKSRFFILIAAIVFALCLVYLYKEFQWRPALAIVKTADIGIFLFGAVFSIVTFWIFRTLRWAVMLEVFGYHKLSFWSLYIAIAYSLGLSMVMPLQSGEILKVEMLNRKSGLPRSDGYFALAIERLLDIVVVLSITIICISFSSFSGEKVISALIIMGVFLLTALIVYLLFHFCGDQLSIVKEIKSRVSILLENPYLLFKTTVLTVLAWACVVFGWWVSLWSIDVITTPVDITGMTTGMTLVNVVSFIPGSVGVSEVGISVWLNYLGIDLEMANAGALKLRAYGLMLLVVGICHWLVVKSFFRSKAPE